MPSHHGYTTTEAAAYLDLSVSAIYSAHTRLDAKGTPLLPATRVGKTLLFKKSDLDRYARQRRGKVGRPVKK
jgi:excisionase family DNA binding protein